MLKSLKIFWNSLMMALQELRVNKLRTSLSLLGIMIGIFCIIAVLTITGSLETNIKNQVESLGEDVIYVTKWPFNGGMGDWWKYVNRPDPTYSDFKKLQQRLHDAEAVCYQYGDGGKEVDHGDDYMTGVTFQSVTQDFNKIQGLNIEYGRYFTPEECNSSGNPVVILGANIWDGLFGSAEKAIGQTVTIDGRQLKVIGTLEKYGSSNANAFDFDNSVFVPYFTAREIVSDRYRGVNPTIMVKAMPNVSITELEDELRSAMRAIRHLSPTQEDNFSLNEMSMLIQSLSSVFSGINTGGWVIGIFALIVGAFGIANIMFVSVKERTSIIGIKKAIGARQSTILTEFLIESVILCLIGGLAGILLVYIGTKIAVSAFDYEVFLSTKNFITGISVSVITGVIAGIIPAYSASRLDPVVAIRS